MGPDIIPVAVTVDIIGSPLNVADIIEEAFGVKPGGVTNVSTNRPISLLLGVLLSTV